MNKNDLIDALAPRLGGRAAAALAVEAVVDVVLRQVAAGGTVGITGFGTFEGVDRAPRTGRNPHTGQAVPIPATRTPRFRPGSYFKAVVTDPGQLPVDGLAGARVGSADDETSGAGSHGTAAPGAPATIRRPAGGAGRRPAPAATADGTDTGTSHDRRRTGTPATVRADRPRSAPAPVAEPAHAPGSGGRLTIGGEQITREMITAKKAQLARAKQDEDTPRAGAGSGKKKGGAAKGSTKSGKKDKKKDKGKKGGGKKDRTA